MRHMLKIAEGVDVTPTLLELQLAPHLWNENTYRTQTAGSPHAQVSDIWIRWAKSRDEYKTPHFPVWYPAYPCLPSIRPIIFNCMARVSATHLGGVLITKIPPGCKVEPHVDRGWHPEFYNCKLYVVLASNDRCTFRVEEEVARMPAGEVWRIDNTKEHEIINDGDTERITLIVCMRCEP